MNYEIGDAIGRLNAARHVRMAIREEAERLAARRTARRDVALREIALQLEADRGRADLGGPVFIAALPFAWPYVPQARAAWVRDRLAWAAE